MRTSCTYHPTASSQTSQNCVYSTCNLDVHMTIQQQILRLQVSVDDVPVVTVLDCRQNLPKLPSGLQLTETPVLCQIVCNQSDRYCVSYMQISMLIILFQTQLKKQHWKGIFILLIVGAWKKKHLWWGASLVQIVAYSGSIVKCPLSTDLVGDFCCFSLESLILTLQAGSCE